MISIQKQILLEKMKAFSSPILRLGLGLVFIWFGTQQLIDPLAWHRLIPESIVLFTGVSAITIVKLNGVLEIVLGSLLILGIFTRIVSLLLALHMASITVVVGYNDVGVRDFGLTLAAISVFLSGPDSFCLDNFLAKRF